MPRLVFNPFTGTFDYINRPGEGQVFEEVPSGLINGTNTVFTTAKKFVLGSLKVRLNGQWLVRGATDDFTVSESGGLGTGFDTITLALAPISLPKPDKILVDYTES